MELRSFYCRRMSRLDTSGDRNRSVLSSSGERNRSVLSASGERNRSVLSRSDDKKKKRFSSRFKAIKKKESIEELPKLLAPGEKIALEGRIKSPRVKHLELPMFFSKVSFCILRITFILFILIVDDF